LPHSPLIETAVFALVTSASNAGDGKALSINLSGDAALRDPKTFCHGLRLCLGEEVAYTSGDDSGD
jgi:hypothetical protein